MTDFSTPERADFRSFQLEPVLERGLTAAGFDEPRPIQVASIPAALKNRDILGLAQTGTGKTAAFALPLLDRIVATRRKGPRALVLAPTRELATQIELEIRRLARFTKVKTLSIYGGASMNRQIQGLRRKPDILVACPGRLLDLHGQGYVDFSRIEALVLDEADHMFDMGFLPSIQEIIGHLPAERQNLLYSATMPKEIRRLADRVLEDPHVVELAHSKPASTIRHALYPVKPHLKREMLKHLLASEDCTSAIVFTRTKHRAKRLADQLSKAGHRATSIQGNLSQSRRDRAMRGFRNGRFQVLVATDIVARGIDVSNVAYVINFDVPNSPEAYTHRIGRTGRAERTGRACTLVSYEDSGWIQATEQYLGEEIDRAEVPGFDRIVIHSGVALTPRGANGRQGRGAPGKKRRAYGRRGRARRVRAG